MNSAALGFRVHSGWACVAAVSLEKNGVAVLWRKRAQLVDILTREYKQPYHAAEEMPFAAGAEHIAKVKAEALRLASQILVDAETELSKEGWELIKCAMLLASARPLPDLAAILASHALIHTAEGALFREAIAQACECRLVDLLRVREKNLAGEAARLFGLTEAALQKRIAELGKRLGPPWSQDEKFATLAAWLALSERNQVRPTRSAARGVRPA
jgi:hypothetical protein